MLGKLGLALVFGFFAVTLALAEEISVSIVAINGNKITVRNKKDSKEYEAVADVKVARMVKKAKEELPDGLKNDLFRKIDAKKGIAVTLITNDTGKVAEILVGAKKKKDAP